MKNGLSRPRLAEPCSLISCTGTALAAATSAPGLGSPLPHLRRDWARRCYICAGTGLAAATSAPGLGSPWRPSRAPRSAAPRPTCSSRSRSPAVRRGRSPATGRAIGRASRWLRSPVRDPMRHDIIPCRTAFDTASHHAHRCRSCDAGIVCPEGGEGTVVNERSRATATRCARTHRSTPIAIVFGAGEEADVRVETTV